MNPYGVIPTYEERRQPISWDALFTPEQISWAGALVVIDAHHHTCGAWWLSGERDSTLVCCCRDLRFRLEAVP